MKKDVVLIVTNPLDWHTDRVIDVLNELPVRIIRLHPEELSTSLATTFHLVDGAFYFKIFNHQNSTLLDSREIKSVWWRRPLPTNISSDVDSVESEFIRFEWSHYTSAMWGSLECFWLDHPVLVRKASNKIEQLSRARRMGFDIPDSIITNEKAEAMKFLSGEGRFIFKVLGDPFLTSTNANDIDYPQKTIKTTLVTKLDVDIQRSIQATPCLFQRYVEKQIELRITVVGNDVFAAEIHSQEHEKTKIDWRSYDVEIPYKKANLPSTLIQMCKDYVKSYNLNYSAIDMIMTPEGKYVFLENNPSGQFMFIQHLINELEIKEAIAKLLANG